MAKQFRAIGPDDQPEESEIVSVFEAGERGSRLDELVQLRRILAHRLDDPGTPAKELSPLVNRHMEVSREIESLSKKVRELEAEVDVSEDAEWSAEAI